MSAESLPAQPATTLATFVHGLRFEHLGPDVVDRAVLAIGDTLACILAGSRLPEIVGLHTLAPRSESDAVIMGTAIRTSAEFAALANGTAGISLELDEGNQFALNHPSMHILPAALAIAEATGRSGRELLTAYVAGYEVATRVGRATHLRDAVHPFGTHAIVGAAAAVAKLLGLSREKIAEAMLMAAGLAITSSQTAANAGASVRNVVTGLTNANAILAVKLTQVGFSAEPAAFDVVFGKILGDAFDGATITTDPLDDYFLLRNYFKVHACSRWNHAPIEATIAALGGHTLALSEIADVTVWTFNPATRLHWPSPANSFAAKHSIPYNVAVRILKGDNGIGAYAESVVADPEVRALAARVAVREDPHFTALVPKIRAARIEITLTNGEKKCATMEYPPGGFDNPFPAGVLAEKFRQLAGVVLSPNAINELDRAVKALSTLANVADLTRYLSI